MANLRHGMIIHKGKNMTVKYKPANRRADLRPGSTNASMKEFLMSGRIQDVASDAAEDIAREAAAIALLEGVVKTGRYVAGFHVQPSAPVHAAGNFRRAATVTNNVPYAAKVEWGDSTRPGMTILTRAGAMFHTSKGIA